MTVGGGIGYKIIDNTKTEWSMAMGPAYQHARFASSQAGELSQANAAALVIGGKFNQEISGSVELQLEYRGLYTSGSVSETAHHGGKSICTACSMDADGWKVAPSDYAPVPKSKSTKEYSSETH